jgi:hypothetical protein
MGTDYRTAEIMRVLPNGPFREVVRATRFRTRTALTSN